MSTTAEIVYDNFINYLYKYQKIDKQSHLHKRSAVASAVTVIIQSHATLLPYPVAAGKMTTLNHLAISKAYIASFKYLPSRLMIV